MRINNISSYNLYASKVQRKPQEQIYNVSSPVSKPIEAGNYYKSNILSFGSDMTDKKIASDLYVKFTKIAALDTNDTEEILNKKTNDFFAELEEQKENVKKHFLLMRNGESESTFNTSLYSNDLDLAKKIVELFKKSDENTRFRLLVPDVKTMGSPFFTAVDYDSSLQIAQELRRMVKTLSKEHQAQFYFQVLANPFGGTTDVIEELTDSGCNIFAGELAEDKKKFIKDNPEIAEKYIRKMGPKIPPEQGVNNIRPQKEETEEKKPKAANYRVYENVKTRFKDVGGLFNVKKQIQNELLNILSNPKVKNADKPSGIILYGPPGTGKTLLATAIAGEANVPFVSANGSSFNEIYVGAGAKHIREIYNTARDLAANSPSKTAIIFIDEADAVAAKRESSNNSEGNHTLNALLGEMDGVQSKEESDIKIITILATNRKDLFDEAFRKGRIDLEFHIDDPRFSEKARREILEINAKNKPFKNDTEKAKLLDELAKTTRGMSGAELADVIKKAYRKTLYNGRKIEYITKKDISDAKLESIFGIQNDIETQDFEMQKTIAHEAGHAINYIVMNKVYENEQDKNKQPVRILDLILNESRGNAAGMTVTKPSLYNTRFSVESLMCDLIGRYGGYSIEETLFDGHTDGVSSDLKVNTDFIIQAVTKYGLGSKTKYIGTDTTGVTFELFKNDIKNDLIEYSNKAMELSSKISEFTKPFIQSYVETVANTKEDKAAIITGEKFETMFKDWLKQNGNQKEYNALLTDLKKEIEAFKVKIKS